MRDVLKPMYVRDPGDLDLAAAATALVDPDVHATFFPHFAATDITDRLGEINVPVLLLNGGADNVVRPEEQHQTAIALSWCKEVVYSNEGHMLPIEAPATTAREIIAFCRYDMDNLIAGAA